MVKPLLVLALVVTPVAHAEGHKPPKAPPKPVARISVAHTPTPADYYVPLDNWLKAHGSPLNGEDFYEIGRQYHLDPDLLISITGAETNFGKVKQRGSSCNVGSVGSYDSTTTTFGCSNYHRGIELIAQTLNNEKLRGYTELWQLSRADNPGGAVYAESRSNWIRNVTQTMSELKGKPVDKRYKFRR